MLARLLILVSLVVCALPAAGQVLIDELGDATQRLALGDLDGDGLDESGVVSLDGGVRIVLGSTGEVLATIAVAASGSATLAAPGDLDGDGLPDVVVGLPAHGSPPGRGRVVFARAHTGEVFASWEGRAPGDRLGASLQVLPDLDGDGHAELAAGAPGSGAVDGEVLVLSGSGSVLAALSPSGVTGCCLPRRFGADLALADDAELVIAMPGEPSSAVVPRVQVFDVTTLLDATPALLLDVVGTTPGWASALDRVADIDGDGHDELLIGAPFGAGATASPVAELRSGTDGALLDVVAPPSPTAQFGIDVAGLGDIDADGVPDFVVSGTGDSSQLSLARAVVYSGADRSVVFDILGTSGPQGVFARHVAVQPDLTGDGIGELSVSDGFEGVLRVYSPSGVIEDLGSPLPGAFGAPQLDVTGTLIGGEQIVVTLGSAAPRAPVFVLFGFGLVAAPLLGGVMLPETIVVASGLATDGAGELTLTERWPVGFPSVTLYVQAWLLDPTGPLGATSSNGLALSAP